MIEKPSILMLSNLSAARGEAARIEALEDHVVEGDIAGFEVVYCGPGTGESPKDVASRVIDAIRDSRCSHLLALAIQDRVVDMDGLASAVDRRPVIYWEGDPWGKGKQVSPEMAAWLELSDSVFSVGGHSQAKVLVAHGARTVKHAVHTYNQVLFSQSERASWQRPERKVAFIGSNLSRMPLVSGLPGSMGRWRLIASLRRRYGSEFLIAGAGWPSSVSVGSVEFGEQDRFIQRARLLANWDHYPSIESYTSDRMAIAMIAGRAQVSTLHPGMDWLPGPETGLFLEPTVGGVIRRTHELLASPAEDLAALGRAAHEWARNRISHREAIRHMLSTVFPDIERPPSDPWDRLPGPW